MYAARVALGKKTRNGCEKRQPARDPVHALLRGVLQSREAENYELGRPLGACTSGSIDTGNTAAAEFGYNGIGVGHQSASRGGGGR